MALIQLIVFLCVSLPNVLIHSLTGNFKTVIKIFTQTPFYQTKLLTKHRFTKQIVYPNTFLPNKSFTQTSFYQINLLPKEISTKHFFCQTSFCQKYFANSILSSLKIDRGNLRPNNFETGTLAKL